MAPGAGASYSGNMDRTNAPKPAPRRQQRPTLTQARAMQARVQLEALAWRDMQAMLFRIVDMTIRGVLL